jgi:hypothetical protein
MIFRTDPDSSRLVQIVQKFYYEFEMPGNKELFGHVAIYVRRTDIALMVQEWC